MADAGSIRAGRAYIELGANDSQLQAALQRASARMHAFGARVAQIGQRMAAAGAAGLAGFGAAANQFANVGEQLYRMSQRTGASVEALSGLRYAASQVGTDLETVEGAMRGVQQAIVQAGQGSAEAQDKFLRLGLRARDLAKLQPQEQFLAIVQQLSRIEHGKRGVDVAMIRRISEATRSSVLWLLAYPPEICQWCEGTEVFR